MNNRIKVFLLTTLLFFCQLSHAEPAGKPEAGVYNSLAEALKEPEKVRVLNLNGKVKKLPAAISKLTRVVQLDLDNNSLTQLPPEIGNLKNLKTLYLNNNRLKTIPAEIGQLTSLEYLGLSQNLLTGLPDETGRLKNLKGLSVSNNKITRLPASIINLKKLEVFNAHGNQLTALPEQFSSLAHLKEIWLGNNRLTALPEKIGQLTSLKKMYLQNNRLKTLPADTGRLISLQRLGATDNQLASLPDEISELNDLEWLYLSGNKLSRLPAGINKLKNLHRLTLEENPIKDLPSGTCRLPQVEVFPLALCSKYLHSLWKEKVNPPVTRIQKDLEENCKEPLKMKHEQLKFYRYWSWSGSSGHCINITVVQPVNLHSSDFKKRLNQNEIPNTSFGTVSGNTFTMKLLNNNTAMGQIRAGLQINCLWVAYLEAAMGEFFIFSQFDIAKPRHPECRAVPDSGLDISGVSSLANKTISKTATILEPAAWASE